MDEKLLFIAEWLSRSRARICASARGSAGRRAIAGGVVIRLEVRLVCWNGAGRRMSMVVRCRARWPIG
jgi:hypothetical protein